MKQKHNQTNKIEKQFDYVMERENDLYKAKQSPIVIEKIIKVWYTWQIMNDALIFQWFCTYYAIMRYQEYIR